MPRAAKQGDKVREKSHDAKDNKHYGKLCVPMSGKVRQINVKALELDWFEERVVVFVPGARTFGEPHGKGNRKRAKQPYYGTKAFEPP